MATTKKRKWFKKLVVAALLGLGMLIAFPWLVCWMGPQTRINKEAISSIAPGMTLADVEAIMGGPRVGLVTAIALVGALWTA
jgi:hypothetical protein